MPITEGAGRPLPDIANQLLYAANARAVGKLLDRYGNPVPEGVDGKELTKTLREKHDTVLGGGQRSLAGRIFRLGHLGWVEDADLDSAIDALAEALPKLGFAVSQKRS